VLDCVITCIHGGQMEVHRLLRLMGCYETQAGSVSLKVNKSDDALVCFSVLFVSI